MRPGPQSNSCVHSLFAEQARNTPDAVALAFKGTRLTYRELDGRSSALALALAQKGVKPESLVAICIERSPYMIIALLAILKAGGAYLPLDSSNPKELLQFMMRDAEAAAVVTQSKLIGLLPEAGAPILLVDEIDLSSGVVFDSPPMSGESLAYVMYTSGSTGAPKGVAIPHRGVTRLVRDTNYATFSSDEVFLQLAPVSFDASTFEIWGPLLNGGKLVVMPPEPPSLVEIGDAIREHGVTTLWLTAGFFSVMVDERIDDLKPLRQLLAGGEALPVTQVRKALVALPNTRLINGYGPTENTTFSCCHTLSLRDGFENGAPIGKPVSHSTACILDEALKQVPPGVKGELYVGGEGLALGYWRRPELTNEKFIADPFSSLPGARLYRTGDLAIQRADGVFEFLGRADDQVKLRGFRIELGEIETVLGQNEGVRACVVVTHGQDRFKELVAYYVPNEGQKALPEQLRDWLRARLPGFMIPAIFVAVSSFPLSRNGKIDRQALPPPQPENRHEFISPQSEMERSVAEIWNAVLGTREIGTAENFFEIGGDSVKLMEVHSKLCRALRRPLGVATLFQYPSIGALARFLEAPPVANAGISSSMERAQKQRTALARNRLNRQK